MFVDTHCHLDFEQYNDDREQVIQRAIKNKITSIITIGIDKKTSKKAIELAEKFAIIFAAVGIHPNDSKDVDEEMIKKIGEMAQHKKVVAIGEIGLDYYRNYSPIDTQQKIFRRQLQLAIELELPVIVHNRNANEDIVKILIDEKAYKVSGVLHSFSGDLNTLNQALNRNFFISFTGPVTFKNTNYDMLINKTPLEQLLLETDSPFLAPVPFRGKRNEPSYLKYTAEKIAKIKNISIEELAQITSENAKNLFKLSV